MDERTLSLIWRTQRFRRDALRTTAGAPVEVVYRGQPHRSPGPDFRDAALVLSGDLRHGDVEVHVGSADWAAHGHDRDPHYDDVILHVVYRAEPRRPARTSKGTEVPCLALEEYLDGAALAASPEVPCRTRLAALDDRELAAALDRLGDERLLDRADLLASDLDGADPEQVLYERLLEVLGYTQNRRPFLELGRRLPLASLFALTHRRPRAERGLICQSLLFGVAGLLPSQRPSLAQLDWLGLEYVEELESAWAAAGQAWLSEVMGAERWDLGGRPFNNPVRRVGAAARYLESFLVTGLAPLLAALRAGGGRRPLDRLVDSFTVEAPDSYWATHFDFGRSSEPRSARLIGRDRALAVAINVALPLAIALARSGAADRDEELLTGAIAAYAAAPRLPANEVTRWMVGEVLGLERARVVDSARRQQGLHHLYRTGCDRQQCDACPVFASGLRL